MTKTKKLTVSEQQPKRPAGLMGHIEENKETITKKLSGSGTTKRLNNFNWLRHEISYNEPKTLFVISTKKQKPYFDYSCTQGLGNAYDYILEQTKQKTVLGLSEICNIHYLICNERNIKINDTYIRPGVIKKTNIPMEIESALENIIYEYRTADKPSIIRAFDVHYKMIALQPFDDYNKRTARMVMNWILLENGYRPIAFTRKSDKEQYQSTLTDMKNGEAKKYYRYMMGAMYSSQNKIINQLQTSKIK